MEIFKVAMRSEDLDPFLNVLPKDPYNSSGKSSGSGTSHSRKLDPIIEKQESDNIDAIDGNTYC